MGTIEFEKKNLKSRRLQEGYAYLLKIKPEKGKGTIIIVSTELMKKVRTKEGMGKIKKPHILVKYHGGANTIEIPNDFKKIILGEKDELVREVGSYKVFPVFHVDKKDPFVKSLEKEGRIKTRVTEKGLLSVEIKLPKKDFIQLTETPLGRFYANGISSFLSIYTHPKIEEGLMNEKKFLDKKMTGKSNYKVLKKHKTLVLKELIGMLQIIRETKGKALVRLNKLTEEEQKEIEKAFKKYTSKAKTPIAMKEYMLKTTIMLKKRMGTYTKSRNISARNLVGMLNKEIENNEELKKHVKEKGIKPFTPEEILKLVETGIEIDEKRKSTRKPISLKEQIKLLMELLKSKKGETKEVSISEIEKLLRNLKE